MMNLITICTPQSDFRKFKIVKNILLVLALIIFCVGIAVLELLSESKGMELRT